jgi:hypothetical protein
LQSDPWNFLWVHNKVLGSHKTPQNYLEPCNVGPRRLGAARPVKFRRGARWRGSGKGRSGPRGPHATDLGPDFGVRRRRGRGTATRRCTRRRRWERRRGGGLGEPCVAQGASLDRGGKCLDGWAAGKTSGMGARRDGRLWQCGGSGVGVARLFLRARAEGESPSTAFIPGPKAVGQCLECQGRGVAAWAQATATYASVQRRLGWVVGAVTADAWHERNGEEGQRMRRPIPPRKPRGARGASASMPGPRWGLRRRQRTAWRPASRCTLWSAGCPKYFQVALFDRPKLQKV